jgi:hypothetical protein
MARYEITAPDGSRYEITAPDDASEQDVMTYAQQQFAQAQPRQRPAIGEQGPVAAPAMQTPNIPQPQAQPQAEASAGRFGFVPPGVRMTDAKLAPPDTFADMANSLVAGVVRGGIGLASLPATAEQFAAKSTEPVQSQIPEPIRKAAGLVADYGGPLAWPARMLSGGPTNKPTQEQITGAVESVTGPLYQPQTTAGEYARTVGEFVPGAATPGGLMRKAANVVLPGLASEAAGQATQGSVYEPAARLAGGVVGAMAPNLAMRAVTPFPNPSPERARQVGIMDREGVPLTAGERTGRKSVRWAESVANDVPMSGKRIGAQQEVQAERFTQAAMRRAGITDATRATDDVINGAFDRLGRQIEEYSQRVAIPPDPSIRNRLDRIVRRYEGTVEPSNVNPMPRNILADFSNSGGLTGRQYSQWRSDLGEIARGTQNPTTRQTLYDLQRELDNAAESMLRNTGRRDLADRMARTRSEYRNLLMIAEARAGAGENAALSLISPQKLREVATRFEGKRNYARGRGDMTELANAGNATMFPLPNSGTPARQAAMQMLNMPGMVAGSMAGGPGIGLLAHAGGAISQAAMARALMSTPVQGYLGNQTLARALQNNRARTPIAVGGLSATQDRDQRR